MKNIININTSGEQLISSVDDGTNTLFINGNAIASSNWVGTGNYTTTIEGHNITIAKVADLNGNIIIQKVSDYNYTLNKTSTMLPGLLDAIYPVGSIYMSVNAVDPALLFGGTWEQIKDTFLLAAGDTYNNGDEGGEATHVLTPAETAMKNHSHTMAHTHAIGSSTYFLTNTNAVNRRSIKPGTGTAITNILYSDAATNRVEATNQPSNTNTGGQTEANGAAHNNMPPYLAVNMWKRTA